MYRARMKCHINFDPGGKNPLLLVSVVLIVSIVFILQFGEVQCSTATDDERWQRRPEFPDTSHVQNRFVDRSTRSRPTTNQLTPSPTDGSTSKLNFRDYKTLKLIPGQINLLNDDVLRFKPDEFTGYSEEHAEKRLSALINIRRKLLKKSLTNDLAADIPSHKNEFINENQRTKSIHVEDEMKELKLIGREEEPESLIEKKLFSIHKVDIQEGEDLSMSHPSGGLIFNVGTDEHRHLVKREAGNMGEPENVTLTTENLPTTNPRGDTNASVKEATSESDKQAGPSTVSTPPKSTSSSRTPTVPGTTTQTPKTSSPSITTTVQQAITTLSQKSSSRTSPTVHLQEHPEPTTSKRETVKSHTSQVTEASPKATTSKKETVKSHTSQSMEASPKATTSKKETVKSTEESPTTDSVIEESNASCNGAQCYASRLPYHWTSDASWALASMVFLLSILTFFVLYTGLWKKRNPMSFPLDSSLPPDPNPRINIAELLKTRLAMIPKHLRGKRQMHRKRMNGRRYEELPLHQSNGTCNDEELDYFEDDDEENDLYLRDENTV